MDDDEPLVSEWIKIMWDLIVGVPLVMLAWFATMVVGASGLSLFDTRPHESQRAWMVWLPVFALAVWMCHVRDHRIRKRLRWTTALLVAAWLVLLTTL